MKILIGGVYQPQLDAAQVTITRAMTDPVPTCSIVLKDSNSTIAPQAMQEVLVLDDKLAPNPTINMLLNPSMNPYNTNWISIPPTGLTLSQNPGGGTIATITNVAVGAYAITEQTGGFTISAGYTYCFSGYIQGSSSPTNIGVNLKVGWFSPTGSILSTVVSTGPVPVSTSLVRYSFTVTPPAGAFAAIPVFELNATSNTNSGVITVTEPQFEPVWFPTVLNYPTPWVGPAQPNCQQMPGGRYIRQYRKFAGFLNRVLYSNYHGNVRDVEVDCAGYAWLMSLITGSNSFTNQSDASIIISLLSSYLPAGIVTTTNVITGTTLSSFQLNWDDLRTAFDNLASQSSYYWTIDYYWNVIYAPPGYFSMPISLICDDSANPDMVTTYPAYDFSAEMDYTQPGSTILTIGGTSGGTTYSAQVTDGGTLAQNWAAMGFFGTSPASLFMRKVNESALLSNADCTQRGMAELLQFDYPRWLYHLTTNVELIPGEGIAITSATENLSASVQLIQQVSAKWIGTNELLQDVWEYTADLGAVNRMAIHILSRLFRSTNSNTSAPAIGSTTLVVLEKLGIADSEGTGTIVSNYAQTILADTPIAYYRLAEITGTIADDISGHAYQGTLHGTITQGVTTLLTDSNDATDKAMTFDGLTGYISLPTSLIPTGSNHAWSVECWTQITAIPGTTGNYSMVVMGGTTTGSGGDIKLHVATAGSVAHWTCSTVNQDITSAANVTINTTYHVVGIYDGTNLSLYVNGSLAAGPTAYSVSLTTSFAYIGAYGNTIAEYFPGTIDEAAIYNYALSATQISNHYTAGT